MPVIISREALRKIKRHGWSVYQRECFGFVIGTREPYEVLACLPASASDHWHAPGERWMGVEDKIAPAKVLAAEYGMEVLGFYGSHSMDLCASAATAADEPTYPRPHWEDAVPESLLIVYHVYCCPRCSWYDLSREGTELEWKKDWSFGRGRRLHPSFNQRRMLARWTQMVGPVDHEHRAEVEFPRMYGRPFGPSKCKLRSLRWKERQARKSTPGHNAPPGLS